MMCAFRRLTLFGLAVALATPVAAAGSPIDLRGRVVDQMGHGVEGVSVRLLRSRRDFNIADWSFEDRFEKEFLARTDEHGFFETQFTPDPQFPAYWLRFYDPQEFDTVRYALPEDRDISKTVRKGRPVFETVVLSDHPDWSTVQQWIDRLGAGSPRAKLIRQMGLPDRRDQSAGVESFYYEGSRQVYRFRGGEFLDEESWDPPDGGADGSGEGDG